MRRGREARKRRQSRLKRRICQEEGSEAAPGDKASPGKPRLQPEADPEFNEPAGHGDQEEDTEKIGEESGGHQQDASDQDQRSVQHLGGREPPPYQFLPDLGDDPETLAAHQVGA